ncbi:MAG: DUF2269 domain-containing protein [Pseudonocardia sp.]
MNAPAATATRHAAAPRTPARPRRLRPSTRRLVLVLHVAVSVGALGVYLGLLTLAITGLTTDHPETLRTAYLAMGIVADILIIPVNLAILITGIVLALGTRWGLLHHYWVLTKLVLTLGLATASIFGLRARIAEAIDHLPAGPATVVDVGPVGVLLVILLPVALAIYLATTALSVYKPWGRTRMRSS